jgi:putative Mg2+ transporter-C (MgtC) family protein
MAMLPAAVLTPIDCALAAFHSRENSDAGDGELGLGQAALRLVLATAAAALIGWEREQKQRPAGLRTHMLVGLGACLFTLLAIDVTQRAGTAGGSGDTLRVVEGIVGGIGFLGAGAIMQSRGSVQGLTTAAGIWVVAAIGVAAALGSYWMLGIALALAAVTLTVLGRVEDRWIHGQGGAAANGDTGRNDGDDGDDATPPRTPKRDDPTRRTADA